MADIVSKRKRSEVMSKVRSQGNKRTELALLQLLRQRRIIGWRRHMKLPGIPDFAFPKQRLAVFVDGCFWHGCPRCYRRPASRQTYWDAKVLANKSRDRRVMRLLKERGWQVIRIWEHDLTKRRQPRCATRLLEAIARFASKSAPKTSSGAQ